MNAAHALRLQIERSLEHRFPAALSPAARSMREVAPTGIEAVDALLEGGLPVGAICEITGPECSGRTSLALSFLAGRTRAGMVCAWVDATDSLDPESAAAAGIELRQLLWVRCRSDAPQAKSWTPAAKPWMPQAKPWARLGQALRAADLLLQAGGFAALVLDLGSTAPEHGCRIPLATWFRFRQAADRTRCALLVLGQAPFAQSSAALQLTCAARLDAQLPATVLTGFSYTVQSGRQRQAGSLAGVRKPPASAWTAQAPWAHADPEQVGKEADPYAAADGMKLVVTRMEKRA